MEHVHQAGTSQFMEMQGALAAHALPRCCIGAGSHLKSEHVGPEAVARVVLQHAHELDRLAKRVGRLRKLLPVWVRVPLAGGCGRRCLLRRAPPVLVLATAGLGRLALARCGCLPLFCRLLLLPLLLLLVCTKGVCLSTGNTGQRSHESHFLKGPSLLSPLHGSAQWICSSQCGGLCSIQCKMPGVGSPFSVSA